MKPTLTTTTYVHFEVGEDTGKNREKNRDVPTAAERKTRIKKRGSFSIPLFWQ